MWGSLRAQDIKTKLLSHKKPAEKIGHSIVFISNYTLKIFFFFVKWGSPQTSQKYTRSQWCPLPFLKWPHRFWQPFTGGPTLHQWLPLDVFLFINHPPLSPCGAGIGGRNPAKFLDLLFSQWGKQTHVTSLKWSHAQERRANNMLAKSCESVVPKKTHQKDILSPDSPSPFHKSPCQQRL